MQTRIIFFLIVYFFLTITPPVFAKEITEPLPNEIPITLAKIADDELEQEFKWLEEEALAFTATRNPKHLTQSAENITIITAKEIKQMNYHTLADVLYHVNGIQVQVFGAPGHGAQPRIQGHDHENTRFILDGVTLNTVSASFTDIHLFPVEMIDRIEIIKGPASSVWGSSLGGIINVITKSGSGDKKISGTLQTSYGEGNTGDYRAEAYGTIGKADYYLFGGKLKSDGFDPKDSNDQDSVYSKLNFNLSDRLKARFTFWYQDGSTELDSNLSLGVDHQRLLSTALINYQVSEEMDFYLSLSSLRTKKDFDQGLTKIRRFNQKFTDIRNKATAKTTWKKGKQTVVFGSEFEHSGLNSNIVPDKESSDEWGVFINDTLVFDKLSITAGIRYDDFTDRGGVFWSPNIGGTYLISDNTLIRALFARGYNYPTYLAIYGDTINATPNPDIEEETANSYQIGLETGMIKYLRLKTTLFRHDINDSIDSVSSSPPTRQWVNLNKVRNQGVELDLKTDTFYNTALSAGYTYLDIRNRETDKRLTVLPQYTFDVGIDYDDKKSLSLSLRGHYIWWHIGDRSSPLNSKYNSFITDANITKKVQIDHTKTAKLFFTAHNIFDGSQYSLPNQSNVERWVEAGFRIEF
tara:strand:+ start:318 stop:2225 length:1908 start_codon:yes stop_codon:yes gene_type:complete